MLDDQNLSFISESASTALQTPARGMQSTGNAGAELTYNRRNRIKTGIRWSDIADKDEALRVKQTTKQNVFPRPDYEQLIEDLKGEMAGFDESSRDMIAPLLVHIIKQVYDSIATQPSTNKAPTDEQLQEYIGAVHHCMQQTLDWAFDTQRSLPWLENATRSATAFAGATLGRSTAISDLIPVKKDVITPFQSVYPQGWRSQIEQIRLIGGNKVLGSLQPHLDELKKAMADIKKGWPAKQEAWQKQGLQVVSSDALQSREYKKSTTKNGEAMHYAAISLQISGREVEFHSVEDTDITQASNRINEWLSQKTAELKGKFLLLDKRMRNLGTFDSIESAQEHARSLTKRATKSSKISDKGISVDAAERSGVEYRFPGENISSEQLIETFGFKGVNFGNWMLGDSPAKIAERQLHLNHTYDSFMDLASIMQVPARAMSLEGMLGIAIGAQGGGGGLYAAHFVPGVNEINLTRTAGAGSLAHEWGHALDHYFARQAGLTRQTAAYLSENVTSSRTVLSTDIRPEIVNAFKGIVKAIKTRPITPEEQLANHTAALERCKKNLNSWLLSVRNDFKRAATHNNPNSRPAETIQSEFEMQADRILRLDLGDGKIALGRGLSAIIMSEPVSTIRDLYKELSGHVLSLDQVKGLQASLDFYKFRSEYSPAKHQPQGERSETHTNFVKAANLLDADKGGKPYWSTTIELFARAFDAFVSDSLHLRSVRNTYLSHAERDNNTVPSAQEREAINAQFRNLVQTIQTKESDNNVAMFKWEYDEDFEPVDVGDEFVQPDPVDVYIEGAPMLAQFDASSPEGIAADAIEQEGDTTQAIYALAASLNNTKLWETAGGDESLRNSYVQALHWIEENRHRLVLVPKAAHPMQDMQIEGMRG